MTGRMLATSNQTPPRGLPISRANDDAAADRRAEDADLVETLEAVASDSQSPVAQVASAGIWGLSARVFMLLLNLLTIPFTIRLLGPAGYGLWSLFQSSGTWAQLADVGMGTASTKFGSERYAHGDDAGESAVIWTALCINCTVACGLGLLAALEAPAIIGALAHVRGPLAGPDITALRLVCGLFIAQIVAGVVNTPQIVRLRWRPYTLVTVTASVIASVGAPLALALFSGGVQTVALLFMTGSVFAAVGNFVLAVRMQPALKRPRLSRDLLRKLLGFGGALTLSGLAAIPLTTAGRVFLAYDHSTVVVAYYGVAATLGLTLYVLPEQLAAPLLPGLTRLEAEGRHAEHQEMYSKALGGLFMFLAPAAVMLTFLAQPFLSLWAGKAYGVHSTGPFLIIVVGACVNCLAWLPVSYLLSSGRTKFIAATKLSLVLPFLVAVYFLSQWLGAVGAALAWSGMLVAESIAYFTVVKRLAPQLPVSPLSRRPLRSALAPVVLAGAAAATLPLAHSLLARLGVGAVLGAVYALGVWKLVLTSGERDGLASLAREILKRGRGKPSLAVGS
ncbi:MAG TPA: oligosaccharide flippase family protein [Acidimicrobiales bacterium]|nr:oligosaccharide flippase family protein [Acidimicrobiales bacterium]